VTVRQLPKKNKTCYNQPSLLMRLVMTTTPMNAIMVQQFLMYLYKDLDKCWLMCVKGSLLCSGSVSMTKSENCVWILSIGLQTWTHWNIVLEEGLFFLKEWKSAYFDASIQIVLTFKIYVHRGNNCFGLTYQKPNEQCIQNII
jgi:hypothetical protein